MSPIFARVCRSRTAVRRCRGRRSWKNLGALPVSASIFLARARLGFLGDVEEGHFRFLARESFCEGRADAAATAGDEDGLAGEVGVSGARGRRWRFFGGGHSSWRVFELCLGPGRRTVTVAIQRCKGKGLARRGSRKRKNWSESEARQALAFGAPADSRVLPSFSTVMWSGVVGQSDGSRT